MAVTCPMCKEEGKKSRVYPLGSARTLMGSAPFYDEEGEYHEHDPNWVSSDFRCSNDHRWVWRSKAPCPNCDANTVEPELIRTQPKTKPKLPARDTRVWCNRCESWWPTGNCQCR